MGSSWILLISSRITSFSSSNSSCVSLKWKRISFWILRPKSPFSDGIAVVKRNKKRGLIDHLGNLIVKPEYDDIEDFSEGIAIVEINNKFGAIDKEGKIVIKPQYSEMYSFQEGLAKVFTESPMKAGLIDNEGKVIVEPQFDSIKLFSEGFAAIEVDHKWGLIDKNGKVLGDSEADAELMDNHSDRPEVVEALEGKVTATQRKSPTVGKQFVYAAAPVTANGEVEGVVRVSSAEEDVMPMVFQLWWIFLVAFGIKPSRY